MTKTLNARGGVARRRELLSDGVGAKQLAAAVHLGRILRVRRGWYALPNLNPDLIKAVRVGGRLACVSAARHYGWAVGEDVGLHICVAANASRLHSPHNPAERMSPDGSPGITLHWEKKKSVRTTARWVTSRRETVLQLASCQSPELAVAAFDSFMHLDPVRSAELPDWLAELPRYILDQFESCSALCESFLESIGRIRLAREGLHGEHQVKITGVGRVDLLVNGWLVIEWDGLEHHDNGAAHDEDCHRDAVLASLGYRTLRFTYAMVMHEWYLVIAAIRAVLAGGRPARP
ncbi:type IV toxin-antitoxin system AbiEi family antitoxin domain-containing protein [Leifsonia kafniensis]|uniref:type IV toxin-antitoxin system AbiEi family antitoxin domain-containing protein n=1 Tax=Leifsonia kafniensis TaxID=475957 RepID=UPI0031EB24FA